MHTFLQRALSDQLPTSTLPPPPAPCPLPCAQDERGVSRDEMAAALDDITDGRVPKDRIALKCLCEEMREWPL